MNETPSETEAGFEDSNLTQESFQETQYADASWEVVGDAPGEETFIPLEIDRLEGHARMIDPMFADYGGIETAEGSQRWHLPEGEAVGIKSTPEAVEDDNSLRMTEQEIEAIKKEAYEEGHKAAMEGEIAQNAERMSSMETRLTQLIKDMDVQTKEHRENLEKRSVEFSLDVANKLIQSAVEINPEYIIPIIKEAITHSGAASIKKVRVSPEDMEFIQLIGLEKHLKEFDGTWAFESDTTIKAGCVIESSAGEVDYQLDAAWERIKESVVKVIR